MTKGFLRKVLKAKQPSEDSECLTLIYNIVVLGAADRWKMLGTLPDEAEDSQLIEDWIEKHNSDKLRFKIVQHDFRS